MKKQCSPLAAIKLTRILGLLEWQLTLQEITYVYYFLQSCSSQALCSCFPLFLQCNAAYLNALSITEEQLNVQSFITKQLDSMRVSRYTLITRWHAVWVIVIGGRLYNMLSDC